jgi:hypothetical protein
LALSSLLIICLAAGCGNNTKIAGNAVIIRADEGGTVDMQGDETSLSIPANALSEDTEIGIEYGSLSDYPTLENARQRVLVMTPAGTSLSTPATVLMDPGSPPIGADKVVKVVQYVDGGWYGTQSAEVVSGGLVSASVSLLAPLAIVVEDPPIQPTGAISGTVMHIYTEQPLEGITFHLLSGTNEIDTAVSDADGRFEFDNVPVGTYTVHADVTEEENCYGDPVDKEAVVTEDQTTDVWFGFVPGPCYD